MKLHASGVMRSPQKHNLTEILHRGNMSNSCEALNIKALLENTEFDKDYFTKEQFAGMTTEVC